MASMSTSRDVARMAGVSQSTVSYVMSGKRPVAPETERRVREAMAELGYRPHASARALKRHRSGIIGLVAPFHEDTDTAGQYRYVVALAEAARSRGYELLVISGQEGIEGMERLIGSALCEGILAMDVLHEDERVELARGAGLPCVFIGLSSQAEGVASTDTDFEEVGAACVRLLAERGHRRIVMLNPASHRVAAMGFTHRFSTAVLEAADREGVPVDVVEVARSYPAMARALDVLTARGGFQEAFLVAPGVSADDLVNVLHHRGAVVGRDVSVVAARGSGRAPHSPVDCTCFDADVDTVAATAVRLLIDQLDPRAPRTHSPVLVPAVFRPGASLAPPPREGGPAL